MHVYMKVGKCVFTWVKVGGEMFYAIIFILVYLGHGPNGIFFLCQLVWIIAQTYIFFNMHHHIHH